MTAASVLGVRITPLRAAACRALLAGVASAEAWRKLAPLAHAAAQTGLPLRTVAACALGTACAVCHHPIEDGGRYGAGGWTHAGCS